MNLSDKGAAFISQHEGFRTKWYKPHAKDEWTIGYGFTWGSTAFREWWRAHKSPTQDLALGITEAEAADAFQFVVNREYGRAVAKFLGPAPQHVFDACTSVAYNCGNGALAWKWAAAAKRGDYAEAARRLRTTAITSRGVRLRGLINRRAKEAALLEHGRY